MSRTNLSRPVQLALDDGLLANGRSFFDYGCGRGGDVDRLTERGVAAAGWDPVHRPTANRLPADIVNLGFVINVIEDRDERAEALRSAWKLASAALIVAARPDWEAPQVQGHPRGDGIVTSKGTFQKFFAQDELRLWIEALVGVEPVAAAPGVFYLFRDPAEAAGMRARRFRARAPGLPRPRRADALWEAHRDVLEPVADFLLARGRLPDARELPSFGELQASIGSIRSAGGIIRRVLGDEQLREASRNAADDLLVFLALEAFGGRPKLGELPPDVALDVRAHFGSYKSACAAADDLLFSLADDSKLNEALRTVPFGKVLPDATYLHADYISAAPNLARVYEGAARVLLGSVSDVTIVKLSRVERRVSYLSYPAFEKDAHPSLASSLRADLRTFRVKWRDYTGSSNPPVLHRKEAFVPVGHPSRSKFERLTASEERAGLYDAPQSIGTRQGWSEALGRAGMIVRGHSLRRHAEP